VRTTTSTNWNTIIFLASIDDESGIRKLMEMVPSEHKATIVNQQENDGWTALMFAAHHNHRGIASLLLEHGADPRIANLSGMDATAIARRESHKEVLEILLLAAGPDAAAAETRMTPAELQVAAARARLEYQQRARARVDAELELKNQEKEDLARQEEEEERKDGGLFGWLFGE
jgi:ankyrin repeat protein